ncbi:hypothetical protein G3O08_09345 [Cryomorpha ignava]|uniref:AMP-activated protein kinase glycogen-binding domain-containing protein n=1 Tax=Cryomorpha ignava TaxID=101383 RepID=A0A7K3WPW4_9FLAO|nr:hypothetical protein [Cryomorpha ignava]NEN23703.1 hypothetical protein [Cryomorpha ignava]
MEALKHYVQYGINNLTGKSISASDNNEICFFLSGNIKAKQVLLQGSFCDKVKMDKIDSGWRTYVRIEPGQHFYKFIVDGKETLDKQNLLKGQHHELGRASIFFIENHVFELGEHDEASQIFVAGNFNGWTVGELEMKREGDIWKLPLYLPDGTYAYKFIVDGKWITDPDNPAVRPDGTGNYNSYLSIGDCSVFKLYGNLDAVEVRLAGNFNLWNYTELQMLRTPSGWELHYALAPGMYEYKYVVDNEWILDPNNPYRVERNEGFNSLICIKPNHVFKLDKFETAAEVIVTGTFTDWARKNFKMNHENGAWNFPIYLSSGKYLYRFIVDGEIITDPDNPQTEEAEFDQTCSILKI